MASVSAAIRFRTLAIRLPVGVLAWSGREALFQDLTLIECT